MKLDPWYIRFLVIAASAYLGYQPLGRGTSRALDAIPSFNEVRLMCRCCHLARGEYLLHFNDEIFWYSSMSVCGIGVATGSIALHSVLVEVVYYHLADKCRPGKTILHSVEYSWNTSIATNSSISSRVIWLHASPWNAVQRPFYRRFMVWGWDGTGWRVCRNV